MRAKFDLIGKSQKVASREALFDTKQRERKEKGQTGRQAGREERRNPVEGSKKCESSWMPAC